jgi:hypothetical protein
MAIQISTGSLIALGVSAGDVATIFGLSKRIGNWWSAASGDDEFLSMLDEDEFNILRRRGLIDLPSFNKRWRKEIRLYANGKPTVFKDKDADKVLEQLNRVTSSVTRNILSNVLKELLRTSAMGEELLATQYSNRLNSWMRQLGLTSVPTRLPRPNHLRKSKFPLHIHRQARPYRRASPRRVSPRRVSPRCVSPRCQDVHPWRRIPRRRASYIHAHEVHACEMHVYEVHTHEVHAHEVHAHEVYAYKVHAHEVHAYEVHTHAVHAREMHAYEVYAWHMRCMPMKYIPMRCTLVRCMFMR